MNYNKYNSRCNSGTEWSYGCDGAIGEDDVDNDPNEARDDDEDDGDDLPSPVPLADFSLPESFFSLYGFRPCGCGGIFLRSVPQCFLGQRGHIRERGKPEATQVL